MGVFDGYRITSGFGWRTHPIRGGKEWHTGIDLVKSHKAPIDAFTDGEVLYAGEGKSGTGLGGYGIVVLISDKNGRGQLYAHLDSVAVKKGQMIKKGQVIGYQGATGQVTGSHLHYEVRKKAESKPPYGWIADRKNNCLDPTKYLTDFYKNEQKPSSDKTYKVVTTLDGYVTAADAKKRVSKVTTVKPGTYYVFNESQGMINVTSKKGVPGSWINPADNKAPSKPKKTIAQMATEVIQGKHGNGHETRRKSLGIDKATYEKVRAEVNRRLL
jgi:murein DD-endopeptidase MepM/ murein hydrolase activator NlpD